ncbi:unnamed protein product [Caenorhabditis auriculariae]|uniref:Cadherin domain-containing protein n=1 Tax=Caenorhabditis auriculariae TaxID=2777116 RepID=A0A8S1HDC6_9PELO|nr:unnamed protein product [Caenorhabditis auriculariae]
MQVPKISLSPHRLLLLGFLLNYCRAQDVSDIPVVSLHAPVLQVSSTEGFLPETAEIGTTVRVSPNMQSESLQILVNDDDLHPGMPPATYQYILTGLGATIFAVDQRGFVYLNVPNIDADPPNPSTYQLNVEAREVNTTPNRRSEPVTITIHILDVNDNSPVFEFPIYTANTTALGSDRPVVKVLASDADSGNYGKIVYSITQVTNGAENKFRYDENSNMLLATDHLTPGERYQVVIEATDGGGRSSQAIVIVLATDPSFMLSSLAPLPGMETFLPNPYHTTPTTASTTSAETEETIQTFVTEVSENTPPNTVVVSLGGDESSEHTYFNIVGGNEDGKFSVDEMGTITTAGELDRERTAMYSLQIETRSRNPDQHLYWTLVQITVLDVNDHAPLFVGPQPIRLRLSIDDIEQLTPNMLIGKVMVEDADADDNGRVELRILPPHNKLFAISNEGVVSVNGDFTAVHFGEHDVVVAARDHGDPPKESRAHIQLSVFGTLITVATDAPTNEVFEYTSSIEEESPTPPDDYLQSVTTAPQQGQVFSSFPSPSPVEEPPTTDIPQFPSVQLPNQFPPITLSVPSIKAKNSQEMQQVGVAEQEHGEDLNPSTSTTSSKDYEPYENTEEPTTYVDESEASTPAEEYDSTLGYESTGGYEPETGMSLESSTPPPVSPVESAEIFVSETTTQSTTTTATFKTTTVTSATQPPTEPPRRLAPVFKPAQITVTVDENESEIEVTKAHATYPDGQPGSITYVLHKGDATLFAVSSFSGSVTLLRPLDAEENTSFTIQVSTAEASLLAVDAKLAHFVSITVKVGDVNDWIPNFETANYNFAVQEDTIPGTIVGQVAAFDQDREEPNNRIRYRLVSAGGLESHFNVNAENGLVTLARPIDAFSGEKITLRIEASDLGIPPQSSTATVLVEVVPTSSQLIPNGSPLTHQPSENELQFSLRNYTASVSEAVRPPHLVQVLSVNNKPTDTRFVICSIVSGNYRGAFGVTAGNDGNCELRTQMELDRESVERYLLNITVTAGSQTDFALVSITVLDVNDNVPRFVYDSDLGLSTYFGGVSSNANAFTRVLAVKAEDADLGNSSVVNYALDPLSAHTKYFSISPFGEISTKQSMSQVLQKNRVAFFEIRVSACDSPISGQQLCSKADVVINVITPVNRFKMVTLGLNPQQLRAHEKDMIRSIRQFSGSCNLLNIEKMVEHSAIDNQPRTDIYWYAVNPSTKKICKKHEFRKLFESSSVAMMAGKVQPWFRLDRIVEEAADDSLPNNGILPSNWKTASILLIILAVVIALGAVIGICAVSQRNLNTFTSHSYPQKMGTVYLPNMAIDPRMDKIYETQMLEMPMSDEDMTMKSGSIGAATQQRGISYRNYGRQQSAAYEGDFSIEESMYAINVPGRIDPVTKYAFLLRIPVLRRNHGLSFYTLSSNSFPSSLFVFRRIQTLVIPTPDYPNRGAPYHHKSVL